MSLSISSVVEDIANRYLEWWKLTGDQTNLNGPCPFHDEKTTGAFYMHLDTGLFICHSCGARGSLATFLREIGAPTKFRRRLLEQIGDQLFEKSKPKREIRRRDTFKNHMALNEGLLGIFDFCPTSLLDAGFGRDLLKDHDVGFDKRRMRITFPIRSHLGALMGISGRTVIQEQPRYLLYKAEQLQDFNEAYRKYDINKANFLWNMDRVYPKAFHGDLDHVFVVEGYKACLWLIQHGAWNTVAIQGSYMSWIQQRLLQRVSGSLILFLDNTHNARGAQFDIGTRLRTSHRVLVCEYPEDREDGTQPDDLGEEELLPTLRSAVDFQDWRRRNGSVRSQEARR